MVFCSLSVAPIYLVLIIYYLFLFLLVVSSINSLIQNLKYCMIYHFLGQIEKQT